MPNEKEDRQFKQQETEDCFQEIIAFLDLEDCSTAKKYKDWEYLGESYKQYCKTHSQTDFQNLIKAIICFTYEDQWMREQVAPTPEEIEIMMQEEYEGEDEDSSEPNSFALLLDIYYSQLDCKHD